MVDTSSITNPTPWQPPVNNTANQLQQWQTLANSQQDLVNKRQELVNAQSQNAQTQQQTQNLAQDYTKTGQAMAQQQRSYMASQMAGLLAKTDPITQNDVVTLLSHGHDIGGVSDKVLTDEMSGMPQNGTDAQYRQYLQTRLAANAPAPDMLNRVLPGQGPTQTDASGRTIGTSTNPQMGPDPFAIKPQSTQGVQQGLQPHEYETIDQTLVPDPNGAKNPDGSPVMIHGPNWGQPTKTIAQGLPPGYQPPPPINQNGPSTPQTNQPIGPAPPVQSAQSNTPMHVSDFAAANNKRENSSNNPAIANTAPGTHAVGNGQFQPATWEALMKQYRPDLTNGKTNAEIDLLRVSPQLSQEMTENYAKNNSVVLTAAGLPVNATTLSLAHGYGAGGAKAILTAAPGTPIVNAIGQQALNANKQLIGKTTTQVIDDMARRMGTAPVYMGAKYTGPATVNAQPGNAPPTPPVSAPGATPSNNQQPAQATPVSQPPPSTQTAQNPPSGNFPPTGMAPGQAETIKINAANSADAANKLVAGDAIRTTEHAALSEIVTALRAGVSSGPGSVAYNNAMERLGRIPGFTSQKTQDTAARTDQMTKAMAQLQSMESQNMIGTNAGLAQTINSLPHQEMSEKGILATSHMIQGSIDFNQAMSNAWMNSPEKQNGGDFFTWRSHYLGKQKDPTGNDIQQDPRAYIFQRMNGDERQSMLKGMQPDDVKQLGRNYEHALRSGALGPDQKGEQ